MTRNRFPLVPMSLAVVAFVSLSAPAQSTQGNPLIKTGNDAASRATLRLDVASVKINHKGQGGAWDFAPINGKWTGKAMTIPVIVAYAYDVSGNRVEGVPKALMGPDPGFDIVAKVPLNTSLKDFRLMMRSLLTDRFNAAIHTEVRDIPVNTIEVAKGGVKPRRASGQCVEAEGNASLPADVHRCHEVNVRVGAAVDRTITWRYYGWSVSMADLAAKLSDHRLTVDATGLSGLYDFDVKIESRPSEDQLESQNNFEYAWLQAWEKQAGLLIDRSKTKKRPATVVVVDHVELATPN